MGYCAGDLREHVIYQKKVSGTDDSGFKREVWLDVLSAAAKVNSVSSRDFYAAYAANAHDVITFTTRWVPGLNTSWRILWQGAPYEILEVNLLGLRRDYVQCKARMKRDV